MKKGFTLAELLVTIAVIAILATALLVILNPVELYRQSHDAARVSDMNTITKAVSLYYSDALSNPSTLFMGTSSVIYISIPDPTATSAGNQCQGLNLPTAPTGFTYHCSASSTYVKTDGTGWIPINFNSYATGAVISKIPVDPVNATSSNLYYTYETDGTGGFKVTAFFESKKYAPLMATDGGTDPELYERGTNQKLPSAGRGFAGYWPLDEGMGTSTADLSGNNNTGTLTCTGSGCSIPTWAPGRVAGGSAIYENPSGAQDSFVLAGPMNDPAVSGAALTVSLWVDPTGATTAWQWLVREGAANDENYGFQLGNNNGTGYSGGNYEVSMEGYSGGSFQRVSTNYIVPGNVWSYLTLIFTQNQSVQVYLNGSLNQTLSYPFIDATSSSSFYIGSGYPFANQPFIGYLDDVRIYNRALSPIEIQEMYTAEK